MLVIGGGFIGSEVASVCRELGLPVTLVERGAAPLAGALGATAGGVAARMQRHHGVDLRTGVTVMALEGDEKGRLRRAHLSDGDVLDAEVAVAALGAVRNVEWLSGAGLAADGRGVVCDASCRVFSADGVVLDDVFVAGDVARWPHPLFDGQLLAVEHWDNAVQQAAIAAHNMVRPPAERRAHRTLPAFWSNQFGNNIKSVGLPTVADEVVVTQGSVPERSLRRRLRRGRAGRGRGRVQRAALARVLPGADRGAGAVPGRVAGPSRQRRRRPSSSPGRPAFPPRGQPTHSATIVATGPGPSTPESATAEPGAAAVAATPTAEALKDPRVPPGPPPL